MHGCKLNLGNIIVLVIALQPLHAQDVCGNQCKVNTNLAMVLNVPVNPTAQVTSIGWGMVAGAGYNFNPRHAVIGEFM